MNNSLLPLRRRDGSVRAHARVSPEDFEQLNQHRWSLSGNGYAIRWTKTGMIYLHRLIMGLERGDASNVDHIDGDPLNCTRANMRVVSHAQNLQNHAGCKNASSRYRGVSFNKQRGKWEAYCTVNYKKQNLGLFADEEAAAEAARTYRAQHMPYANETRTNQPKAKTSDTTA
jgi:hypothetical protein